MPLEKTKTQTHNINKLKVHFFTQFRSTHCRLSLFTSGDAIIKFLGISTKKYLITERNIEDDGIIVFETRKRSMAWNGYALSMEDKMAVRAFGGALRIMGETAH